MNLTNYRAEMAQVLGLDNSTSGDQPFMDSWLNEGVANVLVKTHCKVLPFTMTTTAGEGDYTLSTSVLALLDLYVTSQGSDYPAQRISYSELLALRQNASTGSPVRHYATAGANLLMLYPTPSAADTITGLYVPRPATLATGTDSPSEIPTEWHHLPLYFALTRAADADDDASSQMGERYRAMYEQGYREMRRAVFQHGGSRLAPARVGRRRRAPVNPSVSTAF